MDLIIYPPIILNAPNASVINSIFINYKIENIHFIEESIGYLNPSLSF